MISQAANVLESVPIGVEKPQMSNVVISLQSHQIPYFWHIYLYYTCVVWSMGKYFQDF